MIRLLLATVVLFMGGCVTDISPRLLKLEKRIQTVDEIMEFYRYQTASAFCRVGYRMCLDSKITKKMVCRTKFEECEITAYHHWISIMKAKRKEHGYIKDRRVGPTVETDARIKSRAP